MNMKKYILINMILAIGLMVQAQIVEENEMAVVYYMPQTQLAVTVEFDEISQKPGPFYLYAERYLGVKEVCSQEQTRYEVTNISVVPHTVADTHRAYKVVAATGSEAQWLSLTPEGLLYGYNVPKYVKHETTTAATVENQNPLSDLMPLMEEQMVANSIAKMAEGAAKQIYHIREMRINLLGGDVEHTPADGQAMQLVLNELDKREQMLAELFIGTRVVKHHAQTIYYVPNKDVKNHVIGRFSQYTGMVGANDLSGEPIRLTLTGDRQSYVSVEEKAANSKILPSQVYYNLPGAANLTVEYSNKLKLSTTMAIAQYGVAIPLAKSLLNNKNTPRIYFNTQTGNILSIEQ